MSNIEDVKFEDILSHIANSCEGFQDDNLYFGSPWTDGEQLFIMVSDDEREIDHVWVLTAKVYKT